jgi:hypothetical protein
MFWILILSIAVILLWLNYKGRPANFAKGVAKSQLSSYKRLISDNLSKKELYVKVVSTRAGVHKYYSLSEIENDAEKSDFGTMVEILVNREFLHRAGKMPTMEEIKAMSSKVHQIISDDY